MVGRECGQLQPSEQCQPYDIAHFIPHLSAAIVYSRNALGDSVLHIKPT